MRSDDRSGGNDEVQSNGATCEVTKLQCGMMQRCVVFSLFIDGVMVDHTTLGESGDILVYNQFVWFWLICVVIWAFFFFNIFELFVLLNETKNYVSGAQFIFYGPNL